MWNERDVSPTDAARRIEAGALLIDVREQYEFAASHVPGSLPYPLSLVEDWWQALPTDSTIVFICNSGNRSGQLVDALRHRDGFGKVFNLHGGIIE